MNAMLRTKLSLLLAAGALTVAGSARATEQTAVNTVHFIRTHDSGLDWFSLSGFFSSTTTCPTYSGYVVLKVRDDEKGRRMMALVTAAYLAGKSITVDIDDGLKDSDGY